MEKARGIESSKEKSPFVIINRGGTVIGEIEVGKIGEKREGLKGTGPREAIVAQIEGLDLLQLRIWEGKEPIKELLERSMDLMERGR
ncbi:hypothetical protein AXF42_Ash015532 [Apostasia shenzhenica]|uniref:Uncharacterized protein n=1 Tax=Apostasia shenzhenica TaxID=1088818 RepID=A0A2I0AKH6_9ASPA|nr:hypothetical protein AXF42_Ash015532 [Apostasia shenzhenica]